MYFFIDEQPIFIHHNLYHKLLNKATEGWPPIEKILANMKGSKHVKEVDKTIFQYLTDAKKKDRQQFKDNYENFLFVGEEVELNVMCLLYDYCHYYSCGFLSSDKSFVDRLIADYNNEPETSFILNYIVKIPRKWLGIFGSDQIKHIQFYIKIDNIRKIQGSLTNFVVVTDTFTLLCGEELQVY